MKVVTYNLWKQRSSREDTDIVERVELSHGVEGALSIVGKSSAVSLLLGGSWAS